MPPVVDLFAFSPEETNRLYELLQEHSELTANASDLAQLSDIDRAGYRRDADLLKRLSKQFLPWP